MSQQNFKKQTNSATYVPDANYLAIFYSTDLGAWAYKDENGIVTQFISDPLRIRAHTAVSMSITNQDFVRVVGSAAPVTITLPNATTNTKVRTIKQDSAFDITIVGVSGQTIDGQANVQFKANKKTGLSFESEDGKWFLIG